MSRRFPLPVPIWSPAVLALLAGHVFLTGAVMPATRTGRAVPVIAAQPERVLADVEAQPERRDAGGLTRRPLPLGIWRR